MMTAWQGSKFLDLTLCPLSSVPVPALAKSKPRAKVGRELSAPGHRSLALQGTDQVDKAG